MAESQQAVLPKAVRRAARAAEREHEKAYGTKDTAPEAPQPPPEAPAHEASAQVVELAHQAPEQPEAPPAEATAPETSEPPPQAPEQPAPAVDWEQKYRTLQGMIKSKDREIQGMQATLAAVSKVGEPSPPSSPTDIPSGAPVSPRKPVQRHLKSEDVAAYGQEFIDVMKAAALDAASEQFLPEIDSLRAENAELKRQIGGVSQQAAQSEAARAEAFVAQHVPNWHEVNEDPGFIEWLQEPDPYAGVQRQTLLNSAAQAHDGPRIAAFFTGYLNQTQAIRGHQEAQPSAPPQASPQPVQQSQPTVDKASLVAPGRPSTSGGNGAGAATDTEEPQFFTDRQVAAFYRDVTAGKYRRNPKDKDRIEKAIHKAAAAGRIRPEQGQRPVM